MGTKTYSQMLSTLKNLNVTRNTSLDELSELLIQRDGGISSYYIPFDYINPKAKVVLVGITPGKTQLINALLSVQESIAQGRSNEETLKLAKDEGAFSGALRKNLVRLLDYIGLNQKLGIASTASLFDEHAHLVQTTSVLRHPVFIKGENYRGYTPNMLKRSALKQQIEDYFKPEVQQLPNALYIPLGGKVAEVLRSLVQEGLLREDQVLSGLPHPAGSNAERIAYFLGNKSKDTLSVKTKAEQLDQDKVKILRRIELV